MFHFGECCGELASRAPADMTESIRVQFAAPMFCEWATGSAGFKLYYFDNYACNIMIQYT